MYNKIGVYLKKSIRRRLLNDNKIIKTNIRLNNIHPNKKQIKLYRIEYENNNFKVYLMS